MGVRGYGRARHVQRCVKKCPHFECVIHRFVLALYAGTGRAEYIGVKLPPLSRALSTKFAQTVDY